MTVIERVLRVIIEIAAGLGPHLPPHLVDEAVRAGVAAYEAHGWRTALDAMATVFEGDIA